MVDLLPALESMGLFFSATLSLARCFAGFADISKFPHQSRIITVAPPAVQGFCELRSRKQPSRVYNVAAASLSNLSQTHCKLEEMTERYCSSAPLFAGCFTQAVRPRKQNKASRAWGAPVAPFLDLYFQIFIYRHASHSQVTPL
ncbi:hypothetical protein B0T16DRAFT_221834 [Cercophora newfieldiana]|uniref:Uncharacterized protein n=1 Tax=Cercophora newfieldiana TaxID=92897 RepID=A0AA40CLZ6_9PEZI|nr:hypothetical protein B0T16DRAFT_221834 [Cercophora newfieldiana]